MSAPYTLYGSYASYYTAKVRALLRKKGIRYEVRGDGNVVYKQEPAAYSVLSGDAYARVYTEKKEIAQDVVMPQLTGLSLKEALQIMAEWNVVPEVEGNGTVVQQMPRPGNKMPNQSKIKLVCKPE